MTPISTSMASSPNGMSSTLSTMSLVNPPDQGSDRRGQDTEGLPPIGVSDAGEGHWRTVPRHRGGLLYAPSPHFEPTFMNMAAAVTEEARHDPRHWLAGHCTVSRRAEPLLTASLPADPPSLSAGSASQSRGWLLTPPPRCGLSFPQQPTTGPGRRLACPSSRLCAYT